MYVPASDQCNVLTSNFGSASTASTSAFTIKVTQVECGSKTLAPNGCVQYRTESTGTIETFNYNSAGGVLLQNQDYAICIRFDCFHTTLSMQYFCRAERGICSVCYFATIFKMNVYNGLTAAGKIN
jgi:hypothetical protein